jgi:uncharacterized protein
MTPLSTLKHPAVRALAWSCFSPPLLRELTLASGDIAQPPRLPLDARRCQWLESLDADPAPLLRHLDNHCPSPRLGLFFESLWHFFLREDPATELIDHNLPIRHDGRTLGEFDILYFCRERQQYHHLELAVKFYLATPQPAVPENPLSIWLGPNRLDRLDIKLQHLQARQLLLGGTAAGRAALTERGIDRVVPELVFNGFLFNAWPREAQAPAPLSTQGQRGYWIPRGRFAAELEHRFPRWHGLDKPDWLSGPRAAREIDEAFWARSAQRPQMFLATDDRGEEALRIFVTPDHWPEPRG